MKVMSEIQKLSIYLIATKLEMEEDLVMEEDAEDEEMEISSGGGGEKTVYPEDYHRENNIISPRFGHTGPSEFSRYELQSISPVHSFGEALDEKNESMALLMHLEKTIVHQDFEDSKIQFDYSFIACILTTII